MKPSGKHRKLPKGDGPSGRKPPLHLSKGKKRVRDLRELSLLQLKAAIFEMTSGKASPDSIHDTRTYLKKIDALLGMIPSTLLGKELKRTSGKLREAARRIGPLRDAQVLVESIDRILETTSLPKEHTLGLHSLREGYADMAKQRRLNDLRRLPEVTRVLKESLEVLTDWKPEEPRKNQLRKRIRKTYRRGRELLAKATSGDGDIEVFHEWRKSVKRLWYQLRITAPFWPAKAKGLIASTGKIGELAGLERDITLLLASLTSAPRNPAADFLGSMIAKKLPVLRNQAMKEGAAFYSKKPSEFIMALKL